MLIGANFANWNCRVHMDTLFAYETCWFAWLYFNTFRPIHLWYPCLLPIDISVLRSFTSAVLAPITTIISKHWICQWKSWWAAVCFLRKPRNELEPSDLHHAALLGDVRKASWALDSWWIAGCNQLSGLCVYISVQLKAYRSEYPLVMTNIAVQNRIFWWENMENYAKSTISMVMFNSYVSHSRVSVKYSRGCATCATVMFFLSPTRRPWTEEQHEVGDGKGQGWPWSWVVIMGEGCGVLHDMFREWHTHTHTHTHTYIIWYITWYDMIWHILVYIV